MRVIATHMHPDHIGLAQWLCAHWNAPLWISATDYHVARMLTNPDAGDSLTGGDEAADFFVAHGLSDTAAIAKIRGRSNYFRDLVPGMPSRYVRMMDGDVLQIGAHQWRCISGYGHAPEHIALYSESLNALLGGDMMLPRISTNVSVHSSEPEANSLRLFLDSIERFLDLPQDVLGLPSHGRPFTGVHRRVGQLQEHHRDRLAEMLDACLAQPLTAAEALPIMFKRQLDVHQITFALGETIAHLHLLMYSGELKRTKDAQGVYRFQRKD